MFSANTTDLLIKAFDLIESIDDALLQPPTSMANFNHFSQRMGIDTEPNQQLESRTVYYRMPPNTSAPPNSMQANAPIMMGGMPSRGPQRFNANNNSGKSLQHTQNAFRKNKLLLFALFLSKGNFTMHRINFGPPPPPPPLPNGQRQRFANR